MTNWQISDIWSRCCYCYRLNFFKSQKNFYQVVYQLHHFSSKLYKITVTCYIVNRKANNLSKTSVTIAVATCGSFCICVLSVSTFFMPCPLCLRLLCLEELFVPSASSVVCSIYVCCLCLVRSICVCCALVSCLLCLRLLWLALFASIVIAVCVYCALVSRLLCLCFPWFAPSTSAVYVLSASFASTVP